MTLVDTHVHLYADAFDADRGAVVERARAAGVRQMLLPAVDLASIRTSLELAERHAGVFAMAGIHPTYVKDAPDDAVDQVEPLLQSKVTAVGETGLDYYWSTDHADRQRDSLRDHARLAARHDLPVVLHVRDKNGSDECARDVVSILREVRAESGGERLHGVFHCFGGPDWLTAEVLDLGFHVGLGGTLTFKNAGVPRATAEIPLDRIVLETDGPYLAPVPHRGKRNEPAYVALVAEKLAEVRGLSVGEVAEATTATARRLFRLPAAD